MEKPIFDEIDRRIINQDKSLYASRMKLFIATKNFEKAFMKSNMGIYLEKYVEWLNTKLCFAKRFIVGRFKYKYEYRPTFGQSWDVYRLWFGFIPIVYRSMEYKGVEDQEEVRNYVKTLNIKYGNLWNE